MLTNCIDYSLKKDEQYWRDFVDGLDKKSEEIQNSNLVHSDSQKSIQSQTPNGAVSPASSEININEPMSFLTYMSSPLLEHQSVLCTRFQDVKKQV